MTAILSKALVLFSLLLVNRNGISNSIIFVRAQEGDVGEAAATANGNDCAPEQKNANGECAIDLSQDKPYDPPVDHTMNSNECFDSKPDCYQRAIVGGCQDDPFNMMQDCRLSCQVCKRECVDHEPGCYGWAQEGECERNTEFMMDRCYKSCICEPPPCKDLATEGSRQCRIWAWHGQCDVNPDFMLKSCRKSCQKCVDKDEPEWPCEDDTQMSCKKWTDGSTAEGNLCDGNWRAKMNAQSEDLIDANFIVEFCPQSCNVCHVHLDERDFDLDIGVPQTISKNDDAQTVKNKVRRKVAVIQEYIQGLPPNVQEYCKMGHELCARMSISEECEDNQHEDLIKYACAASCQKCEDYADSPADTKMILAWYERAKTEYWENKLGADDEFDQLSDGEKLDGYL